MVESIVWFAVGATVFFSASVGFAAFAVINGVLGSRYYALPVLDTLIAGSAYVVLTASAAGLLPELLTIPAIRTGDWILSTPIIAYYVALVAGVAPRVRYMIIAVDVGMILTGFIATVTSGLLRGVFFVVAMAFFLVLVYLFTQTVASAAREGSAPLGTEGLFKSLRDLTVLVWSVYPIVWILENVLGVLQAADASFVFLVMDLTAKVGFMAIVFSRQYALDTLRRTDNEGALAAD